MIAVLKGNAYGMGLKLVAEKLLDHQIDFFAVTEVEEAVELRKYGFTNDILVLNLLLPYMQNADDAKKTGYRAIIISSVLAIIMILIYGLIYPYPSSGKFFAPIYQLTTLQKLLSKNFVVNSD